MIINSMDIPVIIFAQSYDLEYNFRLSAITIPVPVHVIDKKIIEAYVDPFGPPVPPKVEVDF
jgi:hypothetical protein